MYSRNTLPSLTSVPFLGRLSGSYEDLQRGQVSEALVDFTGGVTMTIKLAEAPDSLWDVLTRATYSRTLIGCQTHYGVRLGCALAGQRPPHSPSLHPPAAALASVYALDSPNSLTQSPDVQTKPSKKKQNKKLNDQSRAPGAGKNPIEHRWCAEKGANIS